MLAHSVFLAALLVSPVPGQQKLHAAHKGVWEATSTLPAVRGSALARFAERDFQAREKAQFDRFVKNCKIDMVELKGNYGVGTWSYEASGEVKLNRSGVVSIDMGCYTYLGGAHGIGVTRTYNYGYVNGKPKKLSIWDIVKKEHKEDLRMTLLGKAVKKEGTDWIQEGMVNDFNEDQYNRFWVSRWGLNFEFDPYELGSYASGPFSFQVPWSEIRAIMVPKNPLAGLLNNR